MARNAFEDFTPIVRVKVFKPQIQERQLTLLGSLVATACSYSAITTWNYLLLLGTFLCAQIRPCRTSEKRRHTSERSEVLPGLAASKNATMPQARMEAQLTGIWDRTRWID